MFVYDIEVFKEDWLIVMKEVGTKRLFIAHNDIEELKENLTHCQCLIGFNNYNYDDLILYALIKLNYNNNQIYELSQAIINGEQIHFRNAMNSVVTLDCIQELQMGVGLKATECNRGKSIKETTVPFDIDRKLTMEELSEVCDYCYYDVLNTEDVFNLRRDYFMAKLDIRKEFNLNRSMIKKTRASLASEVLKADPKHLPKNAIKDRLNITYINKIKWENIPFELINFYNQIKLDFSKGVPYEELEKRNIKIMVNDVEHTYGFGGTHAGRKAFKCEGNILYFDVSSFYPSLMIEYNFLSRACENPSDFKNLYDTRFKLKHEGNKMEYIYKILLNAIYGATKDKYSKMFDPVQANNICINGQLLLTDLIVRLSPYSTLIQSNTDGIIFAYDDKDLDTILKIKSEWESDYNLKLGQDTLKSIFQRDVNNYLMVTSDGKIKGKGRVKNWDYNKNNFESYSLPIIDIAFKNYYIDGMSVEDTVDKMIKENKLIVFQIVGKSSSKYDGLAQYDRMTDHYTILPNKVNRIFASKFKNKGMIYKVKGNKYDKYSNTPPNTYIHNDDIESMNPNIIDRDWYIELCKKSLLENIKEVNINNINTQYSLFDIV